LTAKDIFQIIRLKWTDILPLRKTDFSLMPNLNPSTLTNRLAVADERIPEPGDRQCGLRFGVTLIVHIIVRQRYVERILTRKKTYRDKIPATFETWIVVAAVTGKPIAVPSALFV